MTVPIHLVGGFLGAGKTTTVQALLAACAGERVALIVNDFGEAAIDASRLDDAGLAALRNIAAGCVCCTAPSGLAAAVLSLLDEVRPDRILIEPSGLARPQDIIDTLRRGPIATRITWGPTLVVADPSAAALDPALQEEQLAAADIVVINRVDLADADTLATFRQRLAERWPAPLGILETTFGRVGKEVLDWPPGAGPRADEPAEAPPRAAQPHATHDHASHGHDGEHPARAPSTEGYVATSWTWVPSQTFSWDALRAALAAVPGLRRFKGMFHTDIGWVNLDYAGGVPAAAPTAWRRDNRADAIGTSDCDFVDLAHRIDAATVAGPTASGAISLAGTDGAVRVYTRAELTALGGQVADVGTVVPGRKGAGVRLREVLSPWAGAPGARFVVVAGDGLTTEPVAVAAVGEAVLVHSLGEGPLPADQGGPFRILAPADGPRSACANVKDVVRIRVLDG